jgi:hypothetical protein
MKCEACKYENRGWYTLDNGEYVELDKDKKKFIHIDGSFHVNNYAETLAVSLFACPICGTVKMEN